MLDAFAGIYQICALILGILLSVLTIRFLIKVPRELEDMNANLEEIADVLRDKKDK